MRETEARGILQRLDDRIESSEELHAEGAKYFFGMFDRRLDKELKAEIERLQSALATAQGRVKVLEADQKHVLEWALYHEPGGIDLVNRMTTYAMDKRDGVKARAVLQSSGGK